MAETLESYNQQRLAHWDAVARQSDQWRGLGGYYHRRLSEIARHLVAPGLRVLEIGCGQGDLLASVKPAHGVGVDFSPEMIARAKQRHPGLTFVEADAHTLDLGQTFDVIILSDLVNDVWDVQAVLDRVRHHCTPATRVVMNFFSHVWEWPLRVGRRAKLARPNLQQNWLAKEDVSNLLTLSGFETVRQSQEILWILPTPGIDALFNRFLVRLAPFRWMALTNVLVARPRATPREGPPPVVSVIVPARNEAGNVPAIFDRTPEMGGGTELIFVEGHSSDDTYAAIERELARRPGRRAKLLKQSGRGKGDAVRAGFAAAGGEVLMILDADLTVPPEDLPRFYDALVSGKGEFINGVRLVYPMEKQAMRFLNMVGNKFFGWAFSWVLNQPIRDTLCGTKVLYKRDYDRIAANRSYFGDFDPFGDFDLLFGAAKQNLRMIDLPIRYRERTYGSTNIQRWKHGLLLLRMVVFAAFRIKFV
jgi:ubiquinone/menaquinone biosynthesis C-methylase UbiE